MSTGRGVAPLEQAGAAWVAAGDSGRPKHDPIGGAGVCRVSEQHLAQPERRVGAATGERVQALRSCWRQAQRSGDGKQAAVGQLQRAITLENEVAQLGRRHDSHQIAPKQVGQAWFHGAPVLAEQRGKQRGGQEWMAADRVKHLDVADAERRVQARATGLAIVDGASFQGGQTGRAGCDGDGPALEWPVAVRSRRLNQSLPPNSRTCFSGGDDSQCWQRLLIRLLKSDQVKQSWPPGPQVDTAQIRQQQVGPSTYLVG